jgi:hypothetical protein
MIAAREVIKAHNTMVSGASRTAASLAQSFARSVMVALDATVTAILSYTADAFMIACLLREK